MSNSVLQAGAILFDQRHQEYIQLIATENDFYGYKGAAFNVLPEGWVYRKHELTKWSRDTWMNLAAQLRVDCRKVGRLEALVVLGEKI